MWTFYDESHNTQGLVDCLRQIPPVELQAMRLLRELPRSLAGGWFPAVPPHDVATATHELIEYTQSCAALIEKLKFLAPIILPTLEIPEWPL